MKRNLNYLLTAALVCGLSLAATSCKDDDKDDVAPASVVTIGSDLTTRGIEVDMQSHLIQVPIDCNGEWTATLPAGTDWARILDWQVIFEGKRTLRLVIDENLSKADRRTTLNIGNSDGEVTKINVVQFYNFEGQPPTNGSGQAFADKGLGTAIDYDYALNAKLNAERSEDFQPTKIHGLNNLFNITVIQELQKRTSDPLHASAYVESVIPLAELQASLLDSCVAQTKNLEVALTLGVEFGPISFEAHGEYKSEKFESRAAVDYTIIRRSPMYNVYVSPAELATYATDVLHNEMDFDRDDAAWEKVEQLEAKYKERNAKRGLKGLNENGLTDAQQKEIDNMYDMIPILYDYAGIFSANFTKRYNELYNAITRKKLQEKPIDEAEVRKILNAIDNEYGPFFIAGGDYGGSLTMHCKIDTMAMQGTTDFSGELSAQFAGLFDVQGDFHYTEDGYSLLRQFSPDIYIYGGNANETTDQMLACITSGNATDLQRWQGILLGWLDSMYSTPGQPDNSQAAPISYIITPIWTLFSDANIQEICQAYFIEKYRNRGIEKYLGIMNGEFKPTFEELVNPQSDFWFSVPFTEE